MVVRLTAPELAALRAALGDAVLLGLDPVTYRRVVRLQARLDRAVALAERRARRPAEGVGGRPPVTGPPSLDDDLGANHPHVVAAHVPPTILAPVDVFAVPVFVAVRVVIGTQVLVLAVLVLAGLMLAVLVPAHVAAAQ